MCAPFVLETGDVEKCDCSTCADPGGGRVPGRAAIYTSAARSGAGAVALAPVNMLRAANNGIVRVQTEGSAGSRRASGALSFRYRAICPGRSIL